ncbi:hypothetical protein NP493_3g06030 [Ridgeia piscesae]|uniref:Secreted protein n=1 Tax=Ridgeia piscesae TaxID=27915 RepID=A0AAD9PFU9_RIDPI|nr:hypothetical protein NP493_3g06030 [Ridgeia piscesae]
MCSVRQSARRLNKTPVWLSAVCVCVRLLHGAWPTSPATGVPCLGVGPAATPSARGDSVVGSRRTTGKVNRSRTWLLCPGPRHFQRAVAGLAWPRCPRLFPVSASRRDVTVVAASGVVSAAGRLSGSE